MNYRIHFEGRNIPDTIRAIEALGPYRRPVDAGTGHVPLQADGAHTVVSVELEKQRPGIMDLIPHADVVFLSSELATLLGLSTAEEMMAEAAKTAKAG